MKFLFDGIDLSTQLLYSSYGLSLAYKGSLIFSTWIIYGQTTPLGLASSNSTTR